MSFWSVITGTTPQDEQQAQLDAKKKAYQDALDRRAAEGTITPEQISADQSYVDNISLDNTDTAALQGFEEGLNEGFQNVLAAPGKVVGAIGDSSGTLLGGILKNIPWWAWLLAAGALFVWMGGLSLLKGRFAR